MARDVKRLVEDVKEGRAEFEAHLDDMDAAKERYYETVRRLYKAGMPLREIAEAVGVSHQRVQQIVGEDPLDHASSEWLRNVLVRVEPVWSSFWVALGQRRPTVRNSPEPRRLLIWKMLAASLRRSSQKKLVNSSCRGLMGWSSGRMSDGGGSLA